MKELPFRISSVTPCGAPVRVAKGAPHTHVCIFVAHLPINKINWRLDFITFERPSQTLRPNVTFKHKLSCAYALTSLMDFLFSFRPKIQDHIKQRLSFAKDRKMHI
jgi:hypothetical protein